MAEADTGAGAGQAASGGQQNNPSGSGGAGAGVGANGSAGTPWHASFDQGLKDFWAVKKYDIADPVKLTEALTRGYQNAVKMIGVPEDQLLRVPQANADTSDINAYWNKIGVPKEAKDYDFSEVKTSDGAELDPAFLDRMRASFHANRVTKENAAKIVKDVIAHLEENDRTEAAELTATLQAQQEQLKRNWGNNAPANMVVAKGALDSLGRAAGLTPEQINAGWDALTKVGGIGASYAMEMLRVAGARMGEHAFITPPTGSGGDPAIMSRESAMAEINSLKTDRDFYNRLIAGNSEAKRKWENLHKVAFAA